MELKELVGGHLLSGLDREVKKAEEGSYYDADANVFRFVLDGKTYKAIENPDDGYRSYLNDLEVSDEIVQYTFPAQKVIGKMRDNSEYGIHDVIEFYDAVTNELVLAVGTDNSVDYYPSCVMDWYPENLSINKNLSDASKGNL